MCIVLEFVKNGDVVVCVSVGNIGVLMGLVKMMIKLLDGIECLVLMMVILN